MNSNMQKLALAIAMTGAAGVANAAFISGDITFAGGAKNSSFNPLTATVIDFNGDGDLNDTAKPLVVTTSGDFASVDGFIATFKEFDFTTPATPVVNPLWAVGGFSFRLDSVSVSYRDSTNLVLKGSGILSGAGFDDTKGSWSMSIDDTRSGFAFSSGTVPAPAPLALLGLGLLAMAGMRRKSA
ncbi:MAG: PEP-CTERM sorting domain-containing protein [Pseudomonadota bacterium]